MIAKSKPCENYNLPARLRFGNEIHSMLTGVLILQMYKYSAFNLNIYQTTSRCTFLFVFFKIDFYSGRKVTEQRQNWISKGWPPTHSIGEMLNVLIFAPM